MYTELMKSIKSAFFLALMISLSCAFADEGNQHPIRLNIGVGPARHDYPGLSANIFLGFSWGVDVRRALALF